MINYESRWEVVEKNFHRMRVVGSADRLAGIAFQVRYHVRIILSCKVHAKHCET